MPRRRLYAGLMAQKISRSVPNQANFYERMGCQMARLISLGAEMLEAERAAAHFVADEMLREGADRTVVEALRTDALRRSDVAQQVRNSDILPSTDLQNKLLEAFKGAGGRRLPPVGLLIEKRVATKTGYPMFLYSNESQHPGRPHLTILLRNERVNVAIEERPVVLAGKKRLPGLTAAIRAVGERHVELKKEWDDSRPDDQKLENSKRQRKK